MKFPLCCLNLAICATGLGFTQTIRASTVTSTADSGPGSLRAAIAAAINGEVIDFAPALNGATITLTSGSLLISGLQLSIDASSLASGLSISGNNTSRVLGITGSSNVTLRRLTIRGGNAVNQNGGGVIVANGNLQMLDCVVRDCFATFNGGGVNLSFGVTATFDRCRIMDNTSSNLGFGGGLYIGGASTTSIRNCVISGNSNPLGGGLAVANSSPSILNCTIQGNSGGGVRCDSNSNPGLENTILWDNTNTSGTTAEHQLRSLNGSLPVVSYSLVQGAADASSFGVGSPVSWGTGNLNGDIVGNNPQFANAGSDLRLLSTSPALNVGNNLANPGSLDAAGTSRIQDSIVDLGAYEGGFTLFASLHPTLAPDGDENRNGIQNLQEYGMGYDPTSGLNSNPGPTFSKEGMDTLLTINQRSNALDFSTIFQTSPNLGSSWTGLIQGVHYTLLTSTPVNSSRNQLVFRLIATDPKRFYRQSFTTQP